MDIATPGTVLADRYRLTRPLGSGSSAVVWEAIDTSLGRMVAVKLLHGGATAHPAGRDQLRREAQALARLAHPRIITVFDYVEVPGPAGPDGAAGPPQPVLVTELLGGQLLADRLDAGPLTEADARRACAQLAEALGAAHAAGIVHRDLKPGNVMLVGDGVKLLDFGIAQTPADTDVTSVLSPAAAGVGAPGAVAIGSPACMAPEQLTGQVAVPASDVYALGCVLYWCLTGHAPFAAPTLDQVVAGHLHAVPPQLAIPGLPPQVAGLFRQCLAKDPTQRPSAETVAIVLQQQAVPTPRAHQTLVMPAYDTPPPSQPHAAPGYGQPYDQYPEQPYDAPYPRADAATARAVPEQRRASRGVLVLGGLAIAGLAAGATALLMNGGGSGGQGTGAGAAAATSSAPTTAATTTPADGGTSASSTPTAPTAGGSPTDPSDPITFLEQVRSQIQGWISDGTISDPAAGQTLQNEVADLENSVNAAQQNGFGGKKARDIKAKAQRVDNQAQSYVDHNKMDGNAADTLSSEMQQLLDWVNSKNG